MMDSNMTTLNGVPEKRVGWIDNQSRKILFKALKKIKWGCLVIHDEDGEYHFGESRKTAELIGKVVVHHPIFYRSMLSNGSLGAAEAYMDGQWSTPNLVTLVRVMALNLSFMNNMDNQRPWVKRLVNSVGLLLTRNTHSGSRKNIAAHYDLSNALFKQFLDSQMMYSSAIYPRPDASLSEASMHKLETICQKLGLQESDHLLEIGTGWGGLAIYAAQHYGCRVTTTTISKQQYEFTSSKIEALGLQNQITLMLKDYRDLHGKFDKLVSIEMIEAVGHQYYKSYFKSCTELLKPEGLMLIQAITVPDQRYEQARNTVDFIKRYIFPGGCLPSNEIIARCVAHVTDMQIVDLEDITLHYARTLKHWRENFQQRLDEIAGLGFDERFMRMWEYYFCYCEGGFRERVIGTSQIVLAKPGFRH